PSLAALGHRATRSSSQGGRPAHPSRAGAAGQPLRARAQGRGTRGACCAWSSPGRPLGGRTDAPGQPGQEGYSIKKEDGGARGDRAARRDGPAGPPGSVGAPDAAARREADPFRRDGGPANFEVNAEPEGPADRFREDAAVHDRGPRGEGEADGRPGRCRAPALQHGAGMDPR
ncbi:unnamed protein product, partial [Prorocentrum cordatum]